MSFQLNFPFLDDPDDDVWKQMEKTLDEYAKQLALDGDKPSADADIRAQRKVDGVCLECGDRGTFKAMALVCPVHGKIFG